MSVHFLTSFLNQMCVCNYFSDVLCANSVGRCRAWHDRGSAGSSSCQVGGWPTSLTSQPHYWSCQQHVEAGQIWSIWNFFQDGAVSRCTWLPRSSWLSQYRSSFQVSLFHSFQVSTLLFLSVKTGYKNSFGAPCKKKKKKFIRFFSW